MYRERLRHDRAKSGQAHRLGNTKRPHRDRLVGVFRRPWRTPPRGSSIGRGVVGSDRLGIGVRPILRYRPRVFRLWIPLTMIPCTARWLRGPKLQGLGRHRNGSGQSRWHQRTGVSVHGPGSETTCWIPSRKRRSGVRGYSSRLRWRCAVRWFLEPGYRLRDSAGAQRGRLAFANLEKGIFLRRVLAIRCRSLRRPV